MAIAEFAAFAAFAVFPPQSIGKYCKNHLTWLIAKCELPEAHSHWRQKGQHLIEQGDHTQIQMGFKGENIESGIQLRESQQRIILILNSSIKQKDEQQTRLFAEARVGFQRDCRTKPKFDDCDQL